MTSKTPIQTSQRKSDPTDCTGEKVSPPHAARSVGAGEPRSAQSYSQVFACLDNADPAVGFVVAQLGQSLDGRIATANGQSRWINGAAALDHLHRLRAAVDCVIVGLGTVLADDPALTVRRVAGRAPARVVIDPEGKVWATARCMVDDGARRIIIRPEQSPALAASATPQGVEVITLPAINGIIDPRHIVASLQTRGLGRMLVEGGASTISCFMDHDAVDRLHLLVAPMILGSGVMGLSLQPILDLNGARRPETSVHLLDDGNVLFDCNLRNMTKG